VDNFAFLNWIERSIATHSDNGTETISSTIGINYIHYFIHELRPFLISYDTRVVDKEIVGQH
jgi:hypothetical protein